VIIALRAGEIATYGEVAEESGYPGAARAVGGVLARTGGLPWWRVVAATGRLVPGHESEQAGRLRAEGIGVVGGRAVLSFGVAPHGRRMTHPSESSTDRGS
jgi:methylated-DNA-protein-cysteine methyltransferase-like protein